VKQTCAGPQRQQGRIQIGSCFPPHQTVITPLGYKQIGRINVGDLVISISLINATQTCYFYFNRETLQVAVALSNNVYTYRPVETFYHRDSTMADVEYLQITTEDEQSFYISPTHLLPMILCADMGTINTVADLQQFINRNSYYAQRATTQHCLLSYNVDNNVLSHTKIANV
jgi:hypothetical protein